MKEKEKFLKFDLLAKKNILEKDKVLIISAGPSIDNYMKWISKYQDKFIVIAVDVIVRKLEKNGIVPDIVISIDPSPECAKFITTQDPNYLKNCAFIFLSQQASETVDIVKDKSYYFSQVIPLRRELGWLGSVANVGTFSFQTAVHLGAKELYLIGSDAAFNQETGKHYGDDIIDDDSLDNNVLDDDLLEESDLISSDDVIEVKGNLRDTVKTNRLLMDFLDSYQTSIFAFKGYREFKAYNLSDGALIEGIEPLSYEKINKKVNDFETVDINIIKAVSSISVIVEDLHYEDDIKILNNIITRMKKFQKIKISSRNNFLEEKLAVMVWILEKSKKLSTSVFGDLFLHYTELVDIYVNFILNIKQKDIHNKESISKINLMWSTGVLSVIKDMKNSVKK